MMAASQPAQAQSAIDGQWSISHGGTGLITLNADGTYTSTCKAYSNYPDAWCPAPSGTFQYSTMGSASVTFNGADGSTDSYRVSGPVQHPDTITSMFGSRTFSPLVMKKGAHFVCTVWSGTGTSFTRWGVNPLVDYDAAADMLYATGSHDRLGSANIDNTINLAETAPNYFQTGVACPPTPTPTPATHHIGDLDNVTGRAASSLKAASSATWQPKVAATVLDSNGKTVARATVSGTFSHHKGTLTCVTAANGICVLGNFSFTRSTKKTVFTVTNVSVASLTVKSASTYAPKANSDPDGDSNGTTIMVSRP